jgi:hypothetical protein
MVYLDTNVPQPSYTRSQSRTPHAPATQWVPRLDRNAIRLEPLLEDGQLRSILVQSNIRSRQPAFPSERRTTVQNAVVENHDGGTGIQLNPVLRISALQYPVPRPDRFVPIAGESPPPPPVSTEQSRGTRGLEFQYHFSTISGSK